MNRMLFATIISFVLLTGFADCGREKVAFQKIAVSHCNLGISLPYELNMPVENIRTCSKFFSKAESITLRKQDCMKERIALGIDMNETTCYLLEVKGPSYTHDGVLFHYNLVNPKKSISNLIAFSKFFEGHSYKPEDAPIRKIVSCYFAAVLESIKKANKACEIIGNETDFLDKDTPIN